MNTVAPLKIGSFSLHTLQLGSFGLDGGAMFGIVPRVLWQKTNPPDEQNRIDMRTRCLLLIDHKNQRYILVDCGLGDKDSASFKERYKVAPYQLESELNKYSLSTADITDVIATHFHFDHMGGLTKLDRDGKLTSRFPHARIWCQRRNWQHAWNPNEKDRASYLKDNFSLYDNDSRLTLLDGPEEIYPGLKLVLSEGHTIGMQLPFIFDNKTSLMYTADIIPMSAHVKVAWVMGYDCFPVTSIEEKKAFLTQAVDRNTILFFEHCPFMDGARIAFNGKDFEVREKVFL